ncbi:NADH dehydrogenase [ubiquinone] 1 alpha subcomplex subunit 5 [Macrosteles quadrilineatus]|uniref:NADH dehydrogenase [ubiquinone] 1 alpha subcomplex subunit 5 n=1 Tax=Macrosteles quadrilineatus TaxID=74068 RepID=UPI0023E11CE8|nr:NADH dehydrogenase [ubiquinone] 1 alpha subcomplex subunit 5 [Macrosteles quadrilineatus]
MASKIAGQVLKETTGLTGLKVSKNPIHELSVLYGKTLRVLQKMPEEAAYRKYTEEIVSQKNNVVQNAKSVADIESQINCGQVEELIIQAENELTLSRKMLTWRPWEPLAKPPPPHQWTWPPVK